MKKKGVKNSSIKENSYSKYLNYILGAVVLVLIVYIIGNSINPQTNCKNINSNGELGQIGVAKVTPTTTATKTPTVVPSPTPTVTKTPECTPANADTACARFNTADGCNRGACFYPPGVCINSLINGIKCKINGENGICSNGVCKPGNCYSASDCEQYLCQTSSCNNLWCGYSPKNPGVTENTPKGLCKCRYDGTLKCVYPECTNDAQCNDLFGSNGPPSCSADDVTQKVFHCDPMTKVCILSIETIKTCNKVLAIYNPAPGTPIPTSSDDRIYFQALHQTCDSCDDNFHQEPAGCLPDHSLEGYYCVGSDPNKVYTCQSKYIGGAAPNIPGSFNFGCYEDESKRV